jgi:hypothetical protein
MRPLVIGCGALARELVALTRRAGFPEVDLTCLPATLHNRPEQIPAAVRARIHKARAAGRDRLFVAYADCGTGGLLDRVLEEEGVARLEGAHCYEVYAGQAAFAAHADEEPGTFYLTDFLVRNFDRLVVRGLGLDRHPELLPVYFGNYRRVVYLAQTDDAALDLAAAAAAVRLGLTFERRFTGLGPIAAGLAQAAAAPRSHGGDTESTSARAGRERSVVGGGPVTPSQQNVGERPESMVTGAVPRESVTPGHDYRAQGLETDRRGAIRHDGVTASHARVQVPRGRGAAQKQAA